LFRLKIILLSLFISGSVLVGFGLYFLSVINRAGLERIDRELLALGGSQLHAPPRAPLWQSFGKSLEFMEEQRLKDLIFRVTGPEKNVFFRSSGWPREISEASFPEFDHNMAAFPGGDAVRGGEQRVPDSRIFPGRAAGLGPGGSDAPDDNNRPGMPPRFNVQGEQRQPLLPPDDLDRDGQFSPPPADGPFPRPPVRIKKACFRTIKTPAGS